MSILKKDSDCLGISFWVTTSKTLVRHVKEREMILDLHKKENIHIWFKIMQLKAISKNADAHSMKTYLELIWYLPPLFFRRIYPSGIMCTCMKQKERTIRSILHTQRNNLKKDSVVKIMHQDKFLHIRQTMNCMIMTVQIIRKFLWKKDIIPNKARIILKLTKR